jgi:hypothetical protein
VGVNFMRVLISLFVLEVVLFFFSCSKDNPVGPNETGKLVVKSNPSGARIYLLGTDTGKNTPNTLVNLEPGDYNLFLYLQYYDTAYFTVTIQKNLTTTKEITLLDGLPFVDIGIDYYTAYGGDSVIFFYSINQDVLIDSITIERPITHSGFYTKNIYNYDSQMFLAFDQYGDPIRYYLPPSGGGMQYYLRIQDLTYWFNFYGRKAYGAKVYFYLSFQMNI